MTRMLTGALMLISAAGWGQGQGDEQLCERGDRAACHRLGLAAAADGGTTRAWMWLGRACELGEPKACDDAAADATARDKFSQAEYFEEQARRWRANPIPQVPLAPDPTLTPEPIPEPEPEPAAPVTPDAGIPRPLLPEIPGEGVMRAIVTPPPDPPPPRKLEQKCLDDAEYARNALVASTKNDPTAFRPSALWMPPFFMTDAERSYTWAALLYFESKDFEEGSRTRIVPPFFASHCAPESQTLLTPFYSYRTDGEGTASLIFTYFRRRDRLVETDILFPFVWSLRERKTLDTPFVGSGAFLPFAFWRRDPAGAHFTLVPPLFWRWGDDDETTSIAGTVYWHTKASEDRFDLGIPPLYFAGRGKKGDYDVSPLLFWSFRDEQKQSLFLPLLLTWYQSRADGGTTFSAGPLLFVGRDGTKHHTVLAPLFWRWGDDAVGETNTVVANVFLHETKDRRDLGIVPLYFQGRSATDDYDIAPPLFWSFRDKAEQSNTLYLPPLLSRYQSRPHGWSFTQFPFLWAGQEEDRTHVFVPPVFWLWSDRDSTNVIAGNVFVHQGKEGSDFGVAPLYFGGRSANGNAYDVSPLLFWDFRDPQAQTHTLFLTPLLARYQSRPGGWSLTQFPLLWAGQEGANTHLFVPPLFWLWADEETTNVIAANVFVHKAPDRTDFGVVPLYFGGRTHDGSAYDVSPLLFWDFRDSRKHSLFLPAALTWYQSRADGFTLNQFPFIWAGREGKDRHVVVPPLFWHWGDDDEQTTLAALVFWHKAKERLDWGVAPLFFHGGDSAGHASYDVSPLLFWSFREGPKHTLVIPPLLAVHADDGHTSTTYALQTFFQTREYGYTFASFPFLWFGREGDVHHEVVAPLFFNWGDATETTTIAGPVYAHHAPNRRHFGLAPLYFAGRSTAGSYDVSPLLFWSFRDGLKHLLLIPPLLTYNESDGETETTFALQTYFQRRPSGFTLASMPFLFAGREGLNHHTVIPPLLFFRWGDREATTTVAGPVFVREGFERTDWGIVPLYFHGPGYDVSPPLFWSFRSEAEHTLVIPPLLAYHHEDGDTSTTFAVNTFFQTRTYGYTFTSFPFLFLKQEGDTHYAHAPPLFFRWGDRDESTTVAGPVFWHQSKTRHDFGLAPLYFQGRGPDGDYDVSPLFLSYRDAHRATLVIPPLLTWYQKDELTETAWVLQTYFQSRPYGYTLNSFPFLFAGQNGDDFHTFLPPLFWYWGDATERSAIAGPVYWNETPTKTTVWVPPFYFGAHGEDESYDISPALFWAYRSKHKFRLVLPALLSSYTQEGGTVAVWSLNTYFESRENGFTFNFVPFLFMGENGLSHHTFVPPLFWRWGEGLDTTTIVGTGFFHETPERWDFGIAPLYFKGESLKHGAYDVAPPLFWSFRNGVENTLVLPSLLTYWQSRKDGHTFAQVPFFFDWREGKQAHTVSPLLFWNFRDETPGAETNTLFLPPLLTYFERRPKGFSFAQAPLLFMGREGQESWTVNPLLFWNFRNPDANTLFLPPLLTYLQTRENGGFTFAQFPLLFLGRDDVAGTHHTVVPPLFWRWGDKAATTTLVGPVFHRANHETGDTTFGVAPAYFGQRSKDGSRGWDVAPMFYRSFADDEQHMLMFPFFDYRSKGDNRLFVSPLAVHSSDAEHNRTIVAGLFWNMSGPDLQARVVAPLWWDFKMKKSGTRVSTVFPLYWRYEKPEEVTHLFINIMWSSGMTALGKSWSFHLFPLFDLVSYHPKHFLWQVLGGLVGHESQADSERWRAGWVWMDPTKRVGNSSRQIP